MVTLDSTRSGFDQIAETLSGHSDLSAIHFITYGSDEAIALGSDWLDHDNLTSRRNAVSAWGDTLKQSGDILFYGCNLAAGSDGQSLLNDIAAITGADVAASDDPTGAARLGGDWELEFQIGPIETTVAPSLSAQQSWTGLLDITTFQQGNGNGYNSTVDTFLNEGFVTQDNSGSVDIQVDLDDGAGDETTQGLIRFDNIFGTGAGQVPYNVLITSATLTVNVNNVSDAGAIVSMHEMLINWTDTATWSSTGGILINDVEAAITADSILSNPAALG